MTKSTFSKAALVAYLIYSAASGTFVVVHASSYRTAKAQVR